MIECPFCLSELARDAIACRHCARDVSGQMALLRKVEALETALTLLTSRVNGLETGAAPALASRAETSGDTKTQSSANHHGSFEADVSALLTLAVLPLLLRIGAHYLLVTHLGQSPATLLLATLLLPLPFAFAAMLRTDRGLIFWSPTYLTVSILAVLAMGISTYWKIRLSANFIPGMVDIISPLPMTRVEWLQDTKFALSIFLSFFTGLMLGVGYLRAWQPAHPKLNLIHTNVFVIRRGLVRVASPETVDRLGKYTTSVGAIGSALAAAYFGITK